MSGMRAGPSTYPLREQDGELSPKVLELSSQIASAFCAAAEIYLTDAWHAHPCS